MESPAPVPVVHDAARLPPGVLTGPLARRFVAYLVDSVGPALVVWALGVAASRLDPGAGRVLLTLVAVVIGIGWFVVVWWMVATRAASPGMRMMRLQAVALSNGRPVGWSRALVRMLILWVLTVTGIGVLVLAALLARHPRRQGLHDLATDSVVIVERALAPAGTRRSTAHPQSSDAVGAPGRLQPPEAPATPNDAAPAEPGSSDGASVAAPSPSVPQRRPDQGVQSGAQAPTDSGSGSVRLDAPHPVSTSQPTTPAPSAPAAPPPDSGPSPSPTSPVPSGSGDQSVHQPVRTAGRPMHEGWVARLDDGRDIEVGAPILLGRNPQRRPGEDDAELIKIADATRTVSKTHLALGVDAHGMYVMDRGSTNGSTVTSGGGVSTPCPPGQLIQVDEGNIVSFGDHWLQIRRASPTQ